MMQQMIEIGWETCLGPEKQDTTDVATHDRLWSDAFGCL